MRDPRGRRPRSPTTWPPDGPQLRWKLEVAHQPGRADHRLGYDLTNRVTTVTAPLSRITRYTYDTDRQGHPIVNPLNQTTDVEWTPDFKVTKVTEPTGRFSHLHLQRQRLPDARRPTRPASRPC